MTLLVLNPDINFMGDGKGKSEKIPRELKKKKKEVTIY